MIRPNQKRQVGRTLDKIRADHVRRYDFAINRLMQLQGSRENEDVILDVGCGCGYGSFMLAILGMGVYGYDAESAAISFAKKNYGAATINYVEADVEECSFPEAFAATAFEVIEHLEHPEKLLNALPAKYLFGSVPNENAVPHNPKKHPWHVRHYTIADLKKLLNDCGWEVVSILGQKGKIDLEADVSYLAPNSRTLVFEAKR